VTIVSFRSFRTLADTRNEDPNCQKPDLVASRIEYNDFALHRSSIGTCANGKQLRTAPERCRPRRQFRHRSSTDQTSLRGPRAHRRAVRRNQRLLDESAEEAKDYGASTTDTVLFDAEDIADAARVVSEAFEKVGGTVDLVVVAVGLLGDQFAQENDAAAAASVANVNFAWPVTALAEVRRRLVAQGTGRILVMSSVASIRVRRSAYLYGGAKAGLDRLCDGLADSLDGTGVTLQLLRPGVVRTRMTKGQSPLPFTTGPTRSPVT